jgi:TetR/AcrR family transcriptional repressor of nem operon
MARHKSYERDKAIENAKHAFWQYGYQTLGIRAIENLTGLGRFAIRTDFGGKEGLLLETLSAYAEATQRYIIKPLKQRNDLAVLEEIFEALVTPYEGNYGRYGCLLANTWVESVSLQNDVLKKITADYYDEIRAAVADLVTRSIIAGKTRSDVDAKQAGDYFVGCQLAINLINRHADDMTAASGFVEGAKTTIRGWSV